MARHANKTEKSSTSTIAIAEQKCSESTVTTPSTATEAVATSPTTAMTSKTSVGESSSKQPSFLDDVDYDRVGMQEEGTSRATLTKHRRQQTMGSYEKSTNDSPAPCDSLGSSIDDVFYSSQIHKENEFRERKKISKSQMREFREAFRLFDKDGDGCITKEELGSVMRSLGQFARVEELHVMLMEIDMDGDGTVSFEEFVDILLNMTDANEETSAEQEDRELRDAFRVFDKHNRGYITASDLRAVLQCLGEDLDEDEIEDMIKEVDVDGDGRIDFYEFVNALGEPEITDDDDEDDDFDEYDDYDDDDYDDQDDDTAIAIAPTTEDICVGSDDHEDDDEIKYNKNVDDQSIQISILPTLQVPSDHSDGDDD